ncbi:MAG: hypothetical protein JW700_01755 [Candidatus Aenigmarchaeota archaeon]|nr:hypothetical protein [Candidatus Aenigmarchaeota archaeon]
MHLSKLFLLVTAFTLLLTAVQLFGYWVLESLMIMLIVDFFVLAASVQLNGKSGGAGNNFSEKLDSIDKKCSDISAKVDNSALETKLQKHDESVTYLLERLSKKTLDLEERIVKFGNGMVDSMSGIKDKMNDFENKKKGESFSLGELIYTDEEDS